MELQNLERGTKLVIYEELHKRAVSDEYDAVFRSYEGDKLIVVQNTWLYENFDRMNLGSQLNINYEHDSVNHTFIGKLKEKLKTGGHVLIEQLTDIEKRDRRKIDRDEIRVKVNVFGLSEAKVSSQSFERPEGEPDLVDTSFDISSGGLCIITNTLLSSKHDPYYLVEFSLSDKDKFLLPTKIARKSNYPRTKIGRYDYGFQFIFDNLAEEKSRLTRAILNKKIAP